MFNVFEWFVLVLWRDAVVLIVLSDEPRQNQGQGLVDHKLLKAPPPPPPPPPSNFVAGRPKAALLFWFFGGFRCFRCGAPLFIVMLVIY